jgi:hypothetical protein
VLCKFAGVSLVDSLNLTRSGQDVNVVPDKYPTWAAWAQAQSNRLKSWGFNAVGMYSYKYYINQPSGGVPSELTLQVSGHAVRDDGNYYHCKQLNRDYQTMVCGSRFYQPGGGQADVFDSSCASGGGYAGAVMADLGAGGSSNIYCSNCGWPSISTIIMVTTEEGDNLYGLNKQSHEDLGYIIAAHNPMMTTSASGYSYPNKTLDAKLALRDWLHSKYGTVAALNAAWGTSYTTFDTSDAAGDSGIANGSYASYGSGTGLLDEDGTHLLSSAAKSSCSVRPTGAWSANPQIETDLHGFIAYFAQTYGKDLAAAWAQPSASPHPPVFLPLYDAPDYVYQALAPYVDGFWIDPTAGSGAGTPSLTDLQRIIAAIPGTPLILADYSNANPDSPFSANPPPSGEGPQATTQAARGTAMASWWANALHQQDSNGRYVVVGLEHWAFYDQANEGANLGLVTSDHDNPYDGSANIANGEAANYGDALTPLADFLNAGICDP